MITVTNDKWFKIHRHNCYTGKFFQYTRIVLKSYFFLIGKLCSTNTFIIFFNSRKWLSNLSMTYKFVLQPLMSVSFLFQYQNVFWFVCLFCLDSLENPEKGIQKNTHSILVIRYKCIWNIDTGLDFTYTEIWNWKLLCTLPKYPRKSWSIYFDIYGILLAEYYKTLYLQEEQVQKNFKLSY